MGILVECPACRKRGGLKRKICECGYNVQKANSKNYWIEYYLNRKRKRERIGRSKHAAENRFREVQTNLYEREYLEHKELTGNIVDEAMNNENKYPLMSFNLNNRLQVLQNSRVRKHILIQQKSFKLTELSLSELKSELKSQMDDNEEEIQKLISLDAEYIRQMYTD